MHKSIFIFLFLVPLFSFGQSPYLGESEPTGEPDIYYYKFYNDIQMIEIDYLSAYNRRISYLERTQPRGLTWEMVLGPSLPNVYLFRNVNGEIVKKYGSFYNTKLLTVQKSLTISKTHNSFDLQLGSVLGFSQISTRYFPYYLIGSKSKNGSGSFGLIDSLGNEVLTKEYDLIWKNDKTFITRKGNTNELRDIDLKVKFSSNEFSLQPSQFNIGFTDIIRDGKCGLMDSTGKMTIPCEYDMLIDRFNEFGLAKVQKKNKVGFVNTKGEIAIECKYQNVGDFSDGLLNARLNDKWGYINANGKTVIPHKYEIGISFIEGLARVAKREAEQYYFGFIDHKGNEVIALTYSNATDFTNGIAEVMKNGKWIKIDINGIEKK